MSKYTLFLDQWNQPPAAIEDPCIIARSIDEAIEMMTLNQPTRIVIGNAYFDADFLDWHKENGSKIPVEFVFEHTETGTMEDMGIRKNLIRLFELENKN